MLSLHTCLQWRQRDEAGRTSLSRRARAEDPTLPLVTGYDELLTLSRRHASSIRPRGGGRLVTTTTTTICAAAAARDDRSGRGRWDRPGLPAIRGLVEEAFAVTQKEQPSYTRVFGRTAARRVRRPRPPLLGSPGKTAGVPRKKVAGLYATPTSTRQSSHPSPPATWPSPPRWPTGR